MSLLWIKPYFYRIQRVVFYGTLIACILTMVLIAFNWDRNATILVSVIGFDPLKLFKLKSWVMAALHSLIVFGTVDGTYLAIGAANQFSNRVFFDLVRAKIGGFIVLILISTLFGMLTTVGATIWMMRVEKRELTVEDFRVLIYSDSQVYEFLYVYFFQNMAHKMLMLTFMALFCLWEFSGLMLMAEGSVSTMYRFFKSAARLPQFIIRYITLVFHCTALFFVHFIVNGLRQLPYLLAPYVVLIQLATFSLINYQLFFTIVITLNRKYRTVFYTHRKKIRIYYRYVLTGFILFLIAFETFSSGIRHAKIVLSPVILLTLCQMFRYRFVSKTWKSWHPTSRFKPVLYDDFEKFKSQDRGLNGKTMIDEGDWVREKSGRSFLNEEEKEEGFDDEIYEKLRKKREHLCEPTESQKEEDELEMEYNRTMGFLSDTDIVRMIREKD
uniref:Transporter n=2 Tax=Caenorhabditis tropicalis TaxID=1561998 RepID=A0A1I7UH83_9PELO